MSAGAPRTKTLLRGAPFALPQAAQRSIGLSGAHLELPSMTEGPAPEAAERGARSLCPCRSPVSKSASSSFGRSSARRRRPGARRRRPRAACSRPTCRRGRGRASPALPRRLRRSRGELPATLVDRAEVRLVACRPAGGGGRGSPRTPRHDRRPCLRASRRIARAAPPAPPWTATRRRRREAAGGGSGMPARRRSSLGPAGGTPARASISSCPSTRGRSAGRRQLEDGAAMEDLAFDRASLEDGAVLAAEPVEAGGEQSLDRRWQGELGQLARRRQRAVPAEQQPLVDEHRDHLLDEERIALGRFGDSRCARRRRARARRAGS